MKKKIKELTFGDMYQLCEKSKDCEKCPLFIKTHFGYRCITGVLYGTLAEEWPKYMEMEINT